MNNDKRCVGCVFNVEEIRKILSTHAIDAIKAKVLKNDASEIDALIDNSIIMYFIKKVSEGIIESVTKEYLVRKRLEELERISLEEEKKHKELCSLCKQILKQSRKKDSARKFISLYCKERKSPFIQKVHVEGITYDKIAELENIDRRTVQKKIDKEIDNEFSLWLWVQFNSYYEWKKESNERGCTE